MNIEKRQLFNKRQLQYYYNNKDIYRDYYEKNKERIRIYNSNYKKNKYVKKEVNYNRRKGGKIDIVIKKGIFILDFD